MLTLLSHEKISLARSFVWICLFTLIISGTGYGIRQYYLYMRQQRHLNESYILKYITSNSTSQDSLNSAYLIQLLGISRKSPPHLYRLDTHAAEQKLLASPVIRKAVITKLHPSAMRIDYDLRTPLALLGGYENTAVDREGILIPVAPFFSAINKPTFYFFSSNESIKWGQKIEPELFTLAQKIAKIAKSKLKNFQSIDVSHAFAQSLGQRQIILAGGAREQRVILRLHPIHYEKNLDDFLLLEKELIKKGRPYPWIIDFRVSSIALING